MYQSVGWGPKQKAVTSGPQKTCRQAHTGKGDTKPLCSAGKKGKGKAKQAVGPRGEKEVFRYKIDSEKDRQREGGGKPA